MNELYQMMREKLAELYQSESKTVKIDMELFFMLYKAVCDLMQIEKIAKNL